MSKCALVVGNFLSDSLGTRSVCEDLALGLRNAGWAIQSTSNKLGRLARLYDMLATTWRKRHTYAVAQVDVYSGLAFGWAEAVCSVLQVLGKPYVLTLHGGNLPQFAQRWPRRVKRLLASAAAVTTPSSYLYQGMLAYRQDLRLLPNALELARYPFRRRHVAEPRLVWLRAFHSIYNPSLGPQAVHHLAQAWPKLSLHMIGPDKGDGSLDQARQLAAELDIADRLVFQGGVPKSAVPDALNTGDIFINTTNIDNTPVSVLEAMACGLCVVSTNVGGIPYLLDDEQDALLVPPGDAEAMATAVRRILSEPGLAARLSENARAKAERFDWSVVLPQWESLLTDVAREKMHE